MGVRGLCGLVLVFVLGAAPAQAGVFGGGAPQKKLPRAPRFAERLGKHVATPMKVKPSNTADRQGAGGALVRRFQQRPIVPTHPTISGQR